MVNTQQLLEIILAENKENFSKIGNSIPRTVIFPELPGKIKVAIGMRRTGKTYFLLQCMQHILQAPAIKSTQLLYINFEDDRLLPCSQKKLSELLDSFYKLYPENHDRQCYFFLDEIQNVENWHLVVRRFFDTKKIQLFLTGSSAKLLSKEIATSLRGRSVAIEIWPYSFNEYLTAMSRKKTDKLYGQKNKDLLYQDFVNYLHVGGFPEVVLLAESSRRQILQDYVELVVMRDIIERYQIKNITLIRYMIKTLLKNTGCSFSVNKFANDLNTQGILGSRNIIYDYLSYIEDSYLVSTVALFSESVRKTNSNPRKIYAIDTGLVKAFSFSMSANWGHLFENVVFLDLKRSGHKIYYYLTKDKYEVDFLVEDPLGNKKLYQVVWNSEDDSTLQREIRALDAAKEELQLPGEIISPSTYLEQIWYAH